MMLFYDSVILCVERHILCSSQSCRLLICVAGARSGPRSGGAVRLYGPGGRQLERNSRRHPHHLRRHQHRIHATHQPGTYVSRQRAYMYVRSQHAYEYK